MHPTLTQDDLLRLREFISAIQQGKADDWVAAGNDKGWVVDTLQFLVSSYEHAGMPTAQQGTPQEVSP